MTIQQILFLLLLSTSVLADDIYWSEHSEQVPPGEQDCVQYPVKNAIHWSCSHRQRLVPDAQSEAERAQIQAALIKTEKARSLVQQGDLYYDMEDYLKAERAYRQALKLQPLLAAGWIRLAQFYSALNREKDALQIMYNSHEAIADNADIYHETGLIQVRLRDFAQAIISLEKAAQLAPENPHYSYVFGIALNSVQRPDEALDILQQAHQQHPENKVIITALMSIHQDNHHDIEALRYAEKLLAFEPDNPELQGFIMQLKSDAESVKKD